MEFQIKVDEEVFHLPRVTMGDLMLLREHFGVKSMSELAAGGDDPMILAGLLYLAKKNANPEMTHKQLMRDIEAIDIESFGEVEAPEVPKASKAARVAAASKTRATRGSKTAAQ